MKCFSKTFKWVIFIIKVYSVVVRSVLLDFGNECTLRVSKIELHNNYKFEISCQSMASWSNISDVKFDLKHPTKIEILFSDCDFPPNFNLYNFAISLGINKIDSVILKAPKTRLFYLSKNILLNSSLSNLEINGVRISSIPDGFI